MFLIFLEMSLKTDVSYKDLPTLPLIIVTNGDLSYVTHSSPVSYLSLSDKCHIWKIT